VERDGKLGEGILIQLHSQTDSELELQCPPGSPFFLKKKPPTSANMQGENDAACSPQAVIALLEFRLEKEPRTLNDDRSA
jgi:hypothetical protein